MGLFRALVGVTIETVKLPLAVVADVVTLGNACDLKGEGTYTKRQIKKIKEEAEEADN